VEVKVGSDRQSPAQATYQLQIEGAGGLYYIARDFQSFYNWFKEIFKAYKQLPTEMEVKYG